MTVTEAIESVDLEEIIDGMNAYAYKRLKSFNLKNLKGKEPQDFVSEVIIKTLNGTRDWEKATCSFKEFLFGCLRSDIDSFFKTNKKNYEDELEEIPHIDHSNLSHVEQKKLATDLLKKEGADADELTIFDYWTDGVRKPKEISKELDVDVGEIYVITKRLERRLIKIEP